MYIIASLHTVRYSESLRGHNRSPGRGLPHSYLRCGGFDQTCFARLTHQLPANERQFALPTYRITRPGRMCGVHLWDGRPSDREYTALFQCFPGMRDASRPEEAVALLSEKMGFPRKAKLPPSLDTNPARV